MRPIIDVYGLSSVDNVCGQTLREVMALPSMSLAHVTMAPQSVSLWHQHAKMSEVYVILDGKGTLYHGDNALAVEKNAYLILPPKTPHRLRNDGHSTLEHVVLALPPFDPNDVELLDEQKEEGAFSPMKSSLKASVTARDGATLFEFLTEREREELGLGLALGDLAPRQKALLHYHRMSEEIYYVVSGVGRVKLGDEEYDVKRGSVVHIPTNTLHALENRSNSVYLEVLCISLPAYREEDFIMSS